MVQLDYSYNTNTSTLNVYYNKSSCGSIDLSNKNIENIIIHINNFYPGDKFPGGMHAALATMISCKAGFYSKPNRKYPRVEIILGGSMLRKNGIIYDSNLDPNDTDNQLNEQWFVNCLNF